MADVTLELENGFYKGEKTDLAIYEALAKAEKRRELRSFLEKLASTERRHAAAWKAVVEQQGGTVSEPPLAGIGAFVFVMMRRLFGTAFATKVLERNEERGLEAYYAGLESVRMSARGKTAIRKIIKDEKVHEVELQNKLRQYEGDLSYIKSMIFGINDGLVELLAVVAGIAVVANTGLVVAIAGFVVGISGTLSMAAGEYLSSKSKGLVNVAVKNHSGLTTSPAREALYIGIFYFFGSVISILPFALGMSGYKGIIASAILVVIALSIVSTVVAVISDTDIKHRVTEMLAISLGAAVVTILLGATIRYYFGVSI